MVGAMGFYIVNYYIHGGDLKAGSALFAQGANMCTICSLLSLPLMTGLCRRLGKVNTLRVVVCIGLTGALSNFFLYNKDMPYLLLISQMLVAPVGAGFWTITASMKADICDDDELRNGSRREGMFGSIGNWIMKMTMACTFFLAGIILESTGFDRNLGGNQLPEAIFRMRVLFSVVPAVASVLALVLLKFYPLNEKRMEEIRTELEARRSTVMEETPA
jgi:GPH family glycoside/pentoside/hexuronide:cation symporter